MSTSVEMVLNAGNALISTDSRFRRETSGFKLSIPLRVTQMSIDPMEGAGTPIYSKEEVEEEYPILGVLLKTLSKGLDGYDFFDLLFEVTVFGEGTTLCVPNNVQWMRKDSLIPIGGNDVAKLASGFVYFNIPVTVSGLVGSAVSRSIHMAYIQETGELIQLDDGRESLFMYLMQNGFVIPVQEESNGSDDRGDENPDIPISFDPGTLI